MKENVKTHHRGFDIVERNGKWVAKSTEVSKFVTAPFELRPLDTKCATIKAIDNYWKMEAAAGR